jgi:hypothetical protein
MLGNWIRQTTTSTGTGNLTLVAITGFPQFTDQFGLTDYFYYTILNDSDGTPLESGIGHLSSSTVMVRDKVLATYVAGTYSDNDPAAVTLAAGTKRVICSMEQGAMLANAPNINAVSTYRLQYPTGQMVGNSAGVAAMFADIVVYIPTLISTPRTIDAIQFRVSVVGGAGSVSKVGIYNSTLDGKPATLIDQSASINTASAAGIKVGTMTKRRYKPGLYFLAYTCSVSAPTCNTPGTSQINPIIGGDANMLASNGGFYEANATLTLPATAGVTSGIRAIDQIPLLALRLA